MKLTIGLTLFAATGLFVGCGAPATNTVSNMNTNSNANRMANMNTMSNANSMMSNTNTNASTNPMVGGAPMLADKNIVENASNSKDHTTLVAAVKAADLVTTLSGTGPFTVFAPTNAAFEKLPAGTVDTLLKPENKKTLTDVLTYHVVSGKQDAASIVKAIETGNGKATFKTVQGAELTASLEGKDVILTDGKGGKSKVTIADVMQSNGVIHVIDSVVQPK
ncbi:hypothetical protein BH24ACI3_BH24ACI3_02600 [soil metagenome]